MSEHMFDAQIVRRWALAGVTALKAHREELNALNVFPVPDGDTGTNLYLTFLSAYEAELARTGAANDAADALHAMARGALLGARGNSGVILAQTLSAFADVAGQQKLSLRELLVAGAQAARAAVEIPIEGTALTVLDAAAATAPREPGVAALAARESLSRTPEMLESLRLAGVVDAGGRGVVLLLDALTAVWNNQDLDSPPVGFVPTSVPHAHECDADARFELMFHIPADHTDEVRAAIAAHGLSLAITRGHDISQVHIHVDSPHDIIGRASAIAEVRNVRIELLEEVELPRKVVVQAFGSGVVQMLAESGAVIVAAEPDERPSVHDFYAAGLRANANEIIILPSDKDSISVAKLAAAELASDGKVVEVIPTQTLIHSLTAMSVHDVSKDFAADITDMITAVSHVMSIGISVAARNSETPLGSISQGDYLGFLNADLKSVSQDIVDAVCSVAVAAHGGELITMIIGSDISQSDVDDVTNALMTMFPNAELIAHAGRQELWPLMVGIE